MKAVLGLGTDLGDKKQNLIDAVNAIKKLPNTKLLSLSDVYRTKPWGIDNIPDFYNMCIFIDTDFNEYALLGAVLGIEAALGRERPYKYSPRIIDIDLLFYENIILNDKLLTLPHPLISKRDFVLVPLKDIFNDMDILSFDLKEAYEAVNKENIVKLFLKDDF